MLSHLLFPCIPHHPDYRKSERCFRSSEPGGNRATYFVARRKQDGETSTGLRRTASEGSLLLRPAGTTTHTGVFGAETASRDLLKEDCTFVTTRSSFLLRTKHTSHGTFCQVFILSHQLFI